MTQLHHQTHLHARISHEDHALLSRAARIEGSSVRDFVVTVATAAARLRLKTVSFCKPVGQTPHSFAEMLKEELLDIPAMRTCQHRPGLTPDAALRPPLHVIGSQALTGIG